MSKQRVSQIFSLWMLDLHETVCVCVVGGGGGGETLSLRTEVMGKDKTRVFRKPPVRRPVRVCLQNGKIPTLVYLF